jgi:hypothetical protein
MKSSEGSRFSQTGIPMDGHYMRFLILRWFGWLGFLLVLVTPASGAQVAVSGHFTPRDQFQHAMAMVDGTLHEIFFDPARGIFNTRIGYFNDVVSISSFVSGDRTQHVVVATADLRIFDVWWDTQGIHERVIANFRFTRFVQVTAFYDPSERRNHVVTSIENGDIEDLSWEKPNDPIAMRIIGHVDGIIGVSSFHSDDDNLNVVQVVSDDGSLRQITYQDPAGPSAPTLLATFSDVAAVTGFFSPDDEFRRAIVLSRKGLLTEFRYHPSRPSLRRDLITVANGVAVGGYVTPDGFRHVIVGGGQGNVDEVFYRDGAPPGKALLANLHVNEPTLEDASPEEAVGITSQTSVGGRAIGVAGRPERIYALSPNAGVWRADGQRTFFQLSGSPRYGAVIAVHPKDVNHVIVGERNGDASQRVLNRTGVWESTDAGDSWSFAWNPRRLSGCAAVNDTAVSTILFSREDSIFIATPCGVARRKSNESEFSPVSLPQMAFTALTASDKFNGTKRVWARTSTSFFVSETDGDTWTQLPSPPPVIDDLPISLTNDGADQYSLAVVDTIAIIPVVVTTKEHMEANKNELLYYDLKNPGVWKLQILDSGRGTGLGGRRFIKSFLLDYNLVFSFGPQSSVLLGTGQHVFRGKKNDSGSVDWTAIAETDSAGRRPDLHVDIWDVMVPPRYGLDTHQIFVATDGGIYRGSEPGKFQSLAHGFHTHHIHMVSSLLTDHVHRSRLFYPTADNNGWYRNPSPFAGPTSIWRGWLGQGDISWSFGNRSNSALGLFVRAPALGMVIDFGVSVPNASIASRPGQLIYCEKATGQQDKDACAGGQYAAFRVIQPVKDDSVSPLMDMVMLIGNPVAWNQRSFTIPLNPNGGPVLLRNVNFAAHPDINEVNDRKNTVDGLPIWNVEDVSVPAGVTRIWVSGGTRKPVYFGYAPTGQFFRRLNGTWQQLDVGAPLSMNWSGNEGPAFVDPYDPHHIVVVTTQDVRISRVISGDNIEFIADAPLTALITASGQYPLIGNYGGADGRSTFGGQTHADSMGVITRVAFSPHNSHSIAVSSPFTGVFIADDKRIWRSLTPTLPQPFTPVSDVILDYDAATISAEGRGLLRIADYSKAKLATYYVINAGQNRFATLWISNPLPLSDQPVRVVIEDMSGKVVSDGTQVTDSLGRLVFPPGIAQGAKVVVRLFYGGSRDFAPSETAFLFTAPNPSPMRLNVFRIGQGKVSGSGIECPSVCLRNFAIDAPVTLVATPDPGWLFNSWSGDCAGLGPCSLTMNSSKTLTATFSQETPQSARLTLQMRVVLGGGPTMGIVTSSPNGIRCELNQSDSTCVSTFPIGTQITLTGAPHDTAFTNTVFEGFSGACVGSSTCTFTITGDTTVTATFRGLIP